MRINVYLRNIKTGETKIYCPDYDISEPFSLFCWEEGNFSCDCNRSLFLYDYDEDKELDCNSDENIIVIDKITNCKTGEILYEEI